MKKPNKIVFNRICLISIDNLFSMRSLILTLLLFFALTSSIYAQLGLADRGNQQLISLVEPGQLADTVNVWGDVGRTGRYLVPRDITLVQLLSYAGGPGNLRQNTRRTESLFSKTMVRVSISKYDKQSNREVSKHFSFKYSDRVPEEFRTYDLSNEEVVSIQVERTPTFLDYLGVVGTIVGSLTTTYLFYDRIIQ